MGLDDWVVPVILGAIGFGFTIIFMMIRTALRGIDSSLNDVRNDVREVRSEIIEVGNRITHHEDGCRPFREDVTTRLAKLEAKP